MFAIIAFGLARRGRDRLAYLADQLDRAVIEANNRALGIGGFGVEVEHILIAGDVLAIGEPAAHGLPGDAVVRGEPDQSARQQLEGPTGAGDHAAGAETSATNYEGCRPMSLARRSSPGSHQREGARKATSTHGSRYAMVADGSPAAGRRG
jgi:hypothetical protein